MAEEKEKTVQKTYRLPSGDVEMIEALARNRMLGSTPSAVMRTLVSNALQEIAKSEYVEKQLKTLKLLSKK